MIHGSTGVYFNVFSDVTSFIPLVKKCPSSTFFNNLSAVTTSAAGVLLIFLLSSRTVAKLV
jgi:hypothetical protein